MSPSDSPRFAALKTDQSGKTVNFFLNTKLTSERVLISYDCEGKNDLVSKEAIVSKILAAIEELVDAKAIINVIVSFTYVTIRTRIRLSGQTCSAILHSIA